MTSSTDMQLEPRSAGRTLWSWLRRAPAPAPQPSRADAAAPEGHFAERDATAGDVPHGVLLQFPVRGEALLVKLADSLRRRMAHLPTGSEPLLLTLSHSPALRLSFDLDAYVEFRPQQSEYHLVIQAGNNTRVTIDTTDFDALVNCVLEYVGERITAPASLEVAS